MKVKNLLLFARLRKKNEKPENKTKTPLNITFCFKVTPL